MEFKIVEAEQDIKLCYKVRTKVFVEEQNVPLIIEIDDKESVSTHFLVIKDGQPISAGRVYVDDNVAIIGRIAVLKEFRSSGVGLFLMENIVSFCVKSGYKKAILGSQKQALGFYEKLGFVVCSDMYLDANIPHFKMVKNLGDINK